MPSVQILLKEVVSRVPIFQAFIPRTVRSLFCACFITFPSRFSIRWAKYPNPRFLLHNFMQFYSTLTQAPKFFDCISLRLVPVLHFWQPSCWPCFPPPSGGRWFKALVQLCWPWMHWDTYFYFAVPKADFWRGLHQEQLSPRPSLPITRKWQQASAVAEQNACKFRDRSLCLAAASKEIFLIELGSKCVKRSPFPLRTF